MSAIPSTKEPVVYAGNEKRSIYLPGVGYDAYITAMNGLGEYGQAAVSIIAHGGPTGSHGLYWTEGQILHTSDGAAIAHGLAEAAEIVKHLGWTNGRWINWAEIQDVENAFQKASQELGFAKAP
ncbi:hypothetical protein [uncultured Corynebacterium sp.]|uniref:hypothetical protein n=1 Tax=uncultured Corynebacterium sp. TaxID=159447 RepID=UPI002604C401|nr:hypothetical protein [uncultured Corynebacterium sp.]